MKNPPRLWASVVLLGAMCLIIVPLMAVFVFAIGGAIYEAWVQPLIPWWPAIAVVVVAGSYIAVAYDQAGRRP